MASDNEDKEYRNLRLKLRIIKAQKAKIKAERKRRVGLGLGSGVQRSARARRLLGAFGVTASPGSGPGSGKVGRPRGPSGKYVIPGYGAVGVYEYRRWLSQMKARARLRQSQQAVEYERQYERPEEYQTNQVRQVQVRQVQQPISPQRGGNILQAPNFMKGELTNVGQQQADATQANTPVANPDGDYFIEIDPASGRQILRRRIRERWLGG